MLSDKMGFLEEAFAVLNRVYFENSLPDDIIITLQSSVKSYAHFTLNKTWKGKDKGYHEINISVEHLNRKVENILSSMNHEMVHYFCFLNGIKEVSNNARYHNKRFKEEAEKRGLLISYAQSIGYSVTEPTPEFIEVLRQNGLLDMQMDEYRLKNGYADGDDNSSNGSDGEDGTEGKGKKKKTSSTRNYECACGYKLRVTRDMTGKIGCLECGGVYEEVVKNDSS